MSGPTKQRRRFFSPWPKGAPIEGWAEHALSPTTRCLARYVLHLEAELEKLRAAAPAELAAGQQR